VGCLWAHERLAPTRVAAPQPVADRRPPIPLERPLVDPHDRLPELGADPLGRVALLEEPTRQPTVDLEALADGGERRLRNLAGVPLREPVERLDHHVGVPGGAQATGGIAEGRVLTPAHGRWERAAAEPQQRPLLLERLAGSVNRRVGVDLDAVGELADRALELLASTRAQSPRH
jgi:hypothetical protein